MIKKKSINIIFGLFLLTHLLVWTLIPYISNQNLPLDTIEAIAWGGNLQWGFDKHPPLSAFFAEIFYKIFGSSDWAFYLLSQIFIVIGFYFVWKLSEEFFKNKVYCLMSVLLLESIYFFNFTSPEFNVNICQIPFWSLTVYYCWKSINEKKTRNWIFLGLFSGLGFLSKYLFVYLLLAIKTLFFYIIKNKKKLDLKYFIAGLVLLLVITPHLIWLYQNDYSTIIYAFNRTGLEEANIYNHISQPIIFILKQIGILIPFFILIFLITKSFKFKINFKDKKILFLLAVNILPIVFIILTSLLTGAKIRTMWMTPFYLFFGVLFLYLLEKKINLKNLKSFVSVFLIFFTLSPLSYLYISISQTDKRTDYPGKEIAYLVQSKWNKNFSNEIKIVVGDEWFAGNLSYHLNSRPKWFKSIDGHLDKISTGGGVIYAGNPKILKSICPGVYGTIQPVGICMIGVK